MRFWHILFWHIFLISMTGKKLKKSIHERDYHSVLSLLRQYREANNLTQTQLAEKIGADQTFISKIETGERRIDILELRVICSALGISLLDFVKNLETKLK